MRPCVWSMVLGLLVSLVCGKQFGLREDGLCPGNRFLFLSTYVLGRQKDLTLTFNEIVQTAKVDEVVYSDQLFRTYRIYGISLNFTYAESKQKAQRMGQNVLRVSNGTLRVTFDFKWEKVQLGTALNGTGTGTVGSDIITYQKTLLTNSSHQLQWHLSKSGPVNITNGISMSTVQPYRPEDYKILNFMFNFLTNQSTVKDNLLKVINANFQDILKEKVSLDGDSQFNFPTIIHYSYFDYHGPFQLDYNQTLMNSTLAKDGLYLLFSQVIVGDKDFQCGEPVPQSPDDPQFGGLQQFISNSLIKSTMRYALRRGNLDVILTQQFWQSRAFQFFIGDVHEVMPISTKNISTMQQLNGTCKGMDDPVFSFATMSISSYEVKVNFACELDFNTTRLVNVNIVVSYEVFPDLKSRTLDFFLGSVTGKPNFVETGNFKIEYQELAEFMVAETMKLAQKGYVIGSGYKAQNRKFPGVWVKKSYLFLYDSSAKPKQSEIADLIL